ncbi:hypothetical protein D3C85_1866560 [compost metagenome]
MGHLLAGFRMQGNLVVARRVGTGLGAEAGEAEDGGGEGGEVFLGHLLLLGPD